MCCFEQKLSEQDKIVSIATRDLKVSVKNSRWVHGDEKDKQHWRQCNVNENLTSNAGSACAIT